MKTSLRSRRECALPLCRVSVGAGCFHPRRAGIAQPTLTRERIEPPGKEARKEARKVTSDSTLANVVSSNPSPISQPVDADASGLPGLDDPWVPLSPEEQAKVAAHISDDDFVADASPPKVSDGAPVSKAARARAKRRAEEAAARAEWEEWDKHGRAAAMAEDAAEQAQRDAADAALTDADRERLARERDTARAHKLAAYENLLDLFDKITEGERAVARAHGVRARQIEAARLATLTVEQTFPREEAATASKTKGWTAAAIAERSFVTMLATEMHISEKAAGILVDTNRTLHTYFEPTLQKLEAGDMSYRHAQIVVAESGPLQGAEPMTAYETELLPYAETLTPPQFASKAHSIATRHASSDSDAAEERHHNALVHRQLVITPDDDGMATLQLYVDAVAATAIFNRCTDAGKQLKTKEDGRTLTQRRVDAATEILLTGTTATPGTPTVDALNRRTMLRFVDTDDLLATGTSGAEPALGNAVVGTGLGCGITAQVSVHVPALTLLGHGTEEAYLDQYGPISLETAKLLMGSVSTFTRVLTDPDTGVILSVGKTRYTVPAAMRLWLHFRDGSCRFPGCTQPARACDSDHVVDWAHGGETKVTNLASLCPAHHNIKHHTDWRYLLRPDGTAIWISPAGRIYTTDPANYINAG
jgi:hypothetical protein